MQIEEGKHYLTRDGRKVGPMKAFNHGDGPPSFRDESRSITSQYWEADGSFINRAESPFDLLAEWEEPAAPAPEQPVDVVKHMVDRFLSWRLPKDFKPDGGISFEPIVNKGMQHFEYKREPTGTNLFNASQAEAMVRHMLEGLPPVSFSLLHELSNMTPLYVDNETRLSTKLALANDAISDLRRMVKAHADHEMNLAKQIDAMTDTASIYRAECERLRKREAELLEANNGYLERARAAEAALKAMSPVIKPIRPKLRDCPMCGADGKNDEKVAFIAHNHICNDVEYEMGYEVRCVECGASVSDEYESEAVRLWNGKQNAEQCTACGEYLDEGDLVYNESGEGGFIHADCCDKSDVTGFTDEDGNPLQPGDKIPEPFAWEGGAA